MKKAEEYIKIIKDAGLVHASSRKLPLITASCIFFGYNNILKKEIGYSYGTMGNIGKGDMAYFLINEEKAGNLFNKKIKVSALRSLNKKLKALFDKDNHLFEQVKKERDVFKVLKVTFQIYPEVLAQIGFYNSIMRYVKNDKDRAKKLGKFTHLIAKDKDAVANLIYLKIEPLIKNCAEKIGKSIFEGDLLRYLTLKEFKKFLKEKKISKTQLSELSKRKAGYLYLFHKNKDNITADKEIVNSVYRQFIDAERNMGVLKGITAYPGKVVGKVYKVFHGVKIAKPGYVLVTSITKPDDAPLLSKFAAIITDEGGALSHIAVVAREFKIPSIMSTKIATKVLKDGDLVEIDANKGIVRILKKK
ncbi:MAG: PEP-utilizing enzyme [Candidatus Woesearchaeota archaeon]|nr:PEP-utilizing enzyme [Candidatus Woesearchaeota archaeon]